MKILLVDDSALMRKMISKTLRQAELGNVETIEAENGQEALAAVATHAPDVVLCDWNMPVMDGLQFVTNLRTKSKTPVVMLTTEASPDRVALVMKAGANGYVTKPFTAENIARAIRTVVDVKRREAA
jgi:two-component system chemotaxis response regulator CheY